jgi:hypothetical protein
MRAGLNAVSGALLAVAGLALAVVCCAGLPIVVGVLGGSAVGSILIGAPALAVALLLVMFVVQRRRLKCPSAVGTGHR